MDKVFLDTNVIIDVLLERESYRPMLEILQQGDEGKVSLCTSFLSMANIAYIMRKSIPQPELAPTLKQLSSLVPILPMDGDQFNEALYLAGPDFEDVLQAVCAASAGCRYIITRNPKDFRIGPGLLPEWQSPEIISPEGYLAMESI